MRRIPLRQRTLRLLPSLALTLWLTYPAHAQEGEWKRLHQEAGALYSQGNYRQATIIMGQALGVAEKTFGPDHPDVATTLNNLALLYKAQGQYAQAEPLYKRSLAIREKALGPDHPDVAVSLENMALLYRKAGREKEAEALEKRAAAIRILRRNRY